MSLSEFHLTRMWSKNVSPSQDELKQVRWISWYQSPFCIKFIDGCHWSDSSGAHTLLSCGHSQSRFVSQFRSFGMYVCLFFTVSLFHQSSLHSVSDWFIHFLHFKCHSNRNPRLVLPLSEQVQVPCVNSTSFVSVVLFFFAPLLPLTAWAIISSGCGKCGRAVHSIPDFHSVRDASVRPIAVTDH